MDDISSVGVTNQNPTFVMSNRYSNRESYQKGVFESCNQSYSFGGGKAKSPYVPSELDPKKSKSNNTNAHSVLPNEEE